MRPQEGTHPVYMGNYISLVPQDNALEALVANETETINFFVSIPPDLENHAYQPGKWSVKEILNHITDTERIFAYRALCFARKDETLLPSFEENDYVANAELGNRNIADLLEEFKTVRKSTLSLFKSFSSGVILRVGSATSGKISVNSLGFAICGHNLHHMNVIRERYLKK